MPDPCHYDPTVVMLITSHVLLRFPRERKTTSDWGTLFEITWSW